MDTKPVAKLLVVKTQAKAQALFLGQGKPHQESRREAPRPQAHVRHLVPAGEPWAVDRARPVDGPLQPLPGQEVRPVRRRAGPRGGGETLAASLRHTTRTRALGLDVRISQNALQSTRNHAFLLRTVLRPLYRPPTPPPTPFSACATEAVRSAGRPPSTPGSTAIRGSRPAPTLSNPSNRNVREALATVCYANEKGSNTAGQSVA